MPVLANLMTKKAPPPAAAAPVSSAGKSADAPSFSAMLNSSKAGKPVSTAKPVAKGDTPSAAAAVKAVPGVEVPAKAKAAPAAKTGEALPVLPEEAVIAAVQPAKSGPAESGVVPVAVTSGKNSAADKDAGVVDPTVILPTPVAATAPSDGEPVVAGDQAAPKNETKAGSATPPVRTPVVDIEQPVTPEEAAPAAAPLPDTRAPETLAPIAMPKPRAVEGGKPRTLPEGAKATDEDSDTTEAPVDGGAKAETASPAILPFQAQAAIIVPLPTPIPAQPTANALPLPKTSVSTEGAPKAAAIAAPLPMTAEGRTAAPSAAVPTMPAVQAAVAQPNLASPASPAAPPVAVATDGAAVAAPAPTSTPASAPAQVGEATALLRMLSMSATERPATVDSAVRVAVATKGKDTDSAGTDAAVRKVDVDLTVDTPKAAVATAPATASAPTSATVSAPVNLSASLGQQVIDMGAGGQWIDDLAKEIATLANGSGQGSFRLSPEHLGPMRVDIRNGDTGAQVRLTVETQAAETALSQDSDTLKADARLSAIKIGEVTVERVHKLAEPSRSDASNGQNTGGQGNGSSLWQQGSAQAGLGQGMDQGQRQAASQQQAGNQQPAGKVSGGETVLGQAESADRVVDDGRGGGRQARYA